MELLHTKCLRARVFSAEALRTRHRNKTQHMRWLEVFFSKPFLFCFSHGLSSVSSAWCTLPTKERVEIVLSVGEDVRAQQQIPHLAACFRRVFKCPVTSDDIEVVPLGKFNTS